MDEQGPGQRLARARRRRGLSQAALAGLVGRSESWLSQVERGKRSIDSHAVLTRIVEILHIDVSDLTAPASVSTPAMTRLYAVAPEIEQAMMAYPAVADSIAGSPAEPSRDLRSLHGRITAAYNHYQATRYEETGKLLPALIRDTESISRAAAPGDPQAHRLRVHVYDTTAALLNRVGEHALAWTAGDRAMSAAQQSGQPLLTALAAYRLAYILTSRRHPHQAADLAMTAATALERTITGPTPKPDKLSVYGGLHLAAANAASSSFDGPAAASLLRAARAIAAQLGQDTNLMGTAFGPVNVAIHTMSSSARLGDWATVIRIGESLNPAAIPAGLIGRRTQINLDLARAYGMRRQDAAAVNTLLAAEQLSPQLVRYDGSTREVISGLLRREHRPSTPQLRPLARRAGLI